MEYTFEQLPKLVGEMNDKLDQIKGLLLNIAKPPSPVEEEWMNVEQVAAFLKIAVGTVYDKVWKKQLPVYKKGKMLYFKKAELIEYISSGKSEYGQLNEISKTMAQMITKKVR
jgi:excisionase family DNA binding protein